jgi:hypothetical protein
MKSKSNGMAAGILLVFLMAFVWQCTSWISSSTIRLTYYIKDRIYSVEDEVERASVSLQEESVWQDHHDDVKGISRVLFAFWVINQDDSEAVAQFYVSKDSTLSTAEEVRNGATLVLDGVSVPAGDSVYITAQDSYRYLRNSDELKERLMEGRFALYCIAQNVPFEILVPDSAAVMIEFTHAVDWEF